MFSFASTAAGVVPCGGPKKSPRISSIVQITFLLVLIDRRGYSESQKFIIGLDSNKRFMYLALFG